MKLAEQVKKLVNEDLESSYVVFGFEGIDDLEEAHVTLMYFGKIEDDVRDEVCALIDQYFEENEPEKFDSEFIYPAMFGPDKDVKVLLPEDNNIFLEDLRELLTPYNGSEFKDYKPHLSTDLEEFKGTIDRIQMSVSEYREIKTWKLK